MTNEFLVFVVFPVLFALVFLIARNNTNFILCFAAIGNVLIYPYTDEYTTALEMVLTAATLALIISSGDRQYWYQVGLLLFALVAMVFFELDQANGTNVILNNYDITIILITIMQLMGAGYGITVGIFERLRQGFRGDCLPVHSFAPHNGAACQRTR